MRGLALCVVAVLAGGVARADDEQARKDEARRLTELGTQAYERGDHHAALAFFDKARRVFPSPNFNYNRGLALEALGRTLDAVEAFDAFLLEAPDAPEDARAHAEARVRELEKQVGSLHLEVTPAGARATVDGRDLALGRPVRVRAGPHLVQLQRAGHRPAEREVIVTPGETARLEVALAALPPPAATAVVAAPPAARRTTPAYRRWWLWTIVGVALAGAAATTAGVLLAPAPARGCATVADPGLGCVEVGLR